MLVIFTSSFLGIKDVVRVNDLPVIALRKEPIGLVSFTLKSLALGENINSARILNIMNKLTMALRFIDILFKYIVI